MDTKIGLGAALSAAMQARMVANTGKNKKKMKKDVVVKEPNKILRAASMQLPSLASYFADHGEENGDGFTMSGRVTDDEIMRTAQPWSLYLRCIVRPTQQMINGVWFNVVVYGAIFTVVVLVGLDTYVDDVDPATGEKLPMKFIQTCDCFLLEVGLWSYVPDVIWYLEWAVQLTFCLEIVVKVLSYKYLTLALALTPTLTLTMTLTLTLNPTPTLTLTPILTLTPTPTLTLNR